jgi:2-amino-4-hydroxy-6-hydroxymethyldihydropteridine diphosphokinase
VTEDVLTHSAYLCLGSNLGDRLDYLNRALVGLLGFDEVVGIKASPVYESAAHTKHDQDVGPDFLNAVIHIATHSKPEELLEICCDVEQALARVRGTERWLPRTIDIDILLIDGVSQTTDRLTIPHPRIHERRFVLQPLCDIDPNLHVPAPFNAFVGDLLAACGDPYPVSHYAQTDPVTLAWRQTSSKK